MLLPLSKVENKRKDVRTGAVKVERGISSIFSLRSFNFLFPIFLGFTHSAFLRFHCFDCSTLLLPAKRYSYYFWLCG